MSTQHEIDDAMLIAAEGVIQGDQSAYALAAATLADALRTEREARRQAQIRLEQEQDARARAGVDARREVAEQMRALRAAAQAVVDRWDSPLWKDLPHTGEFIARLREALDGAPSAPTAQTPIAWVRCGSDGRYEGPIMDAHLEPVRKASGAWTPLYAAPQPTTTPRQPLTDERIERLMPVPCFSSMNVERWSRADMHLFGRFVERTCAEQWGITLEGGAA